MSDQWYCRVRGRESGPFTAEQLKALAMQGALLPDHLVRQGPQGQWVTANRITGLFQRGGTDAPGAPTSNVAASAAAPPARSAAQAESDTVPQVHIADAGPLAAGAPSAFQSHEDRPRPMPLGAIVVAFALAISGLLLMQFPILPLVLGVAAVLLSLRALPSAYRHSVTFRVVCLVGLVLSLSACCLGGYVTLNSNSPLTTLQEMLGVEELRQTPTANVWYDASAEQVAAGGVFVRVASVTIESLASAVGRETASSAGLDSAEEYLFIELRMENQAGNKASDYLSWSDGIESGQIVPLLADERGTDYRAVSFGELPLSGQSSRTSIAPGETAADLLVFERPVEQFVVLKLILPLSALHERGSIQFEIPHTMVVQAIDSPPAPDDARTTTPAVETARPAPTPQVKERNPLETIEITSEPEDGSEILESRVQNQEPVPD